jgi:predicted Co/Zn/Cd cation transporter (cation efflux family)
VGVHPAGGGDLLVGFLAQLASASTGVIVGLFCGRQVIPRPGYALLLAAVAVLALLLVRWIPPVTPGSSSRQFRPLKSDLVGRYWRLDAGDGQD